MRAALGGRRQNRRVSIAGIAGSFRRVDREGLQFLNLGRRIGEIQADRAPVGDRILLLVEMLLVVNLQMNFRAGRKPESRRRLAQAWRRFQVAKAPAPDRSRY